MLPSACLYLFASASLLHGVAGDAEEVDCSFGSALPRHYVAHLARTPPVVDGQLHTDDAWRGVPWTHSFVDIFDRPAPRLRTRVKMIWDQNWLYIAAWMEEARVWANITKHNQVIFNDNDFEVFIDADGSNHYYKEFEMNAAGATWDLCLNKPYLDGGYENSTRVLGSGGWEMQPPLVAEAAADGPGCTLNDPQSACRAWTAEVALPLRELAYNTSASVPPRDGDFWRINFSRVEWHVKEERGVYVKDPAFATSDPDNWVWSPQGAVNMHAPEMWGLLQFASGPVNQTSPQEYPHWPIRHVAMLLYHAQREFYDRHGRYASSVVELGPHCDAHVLDGTCVREPLIKTSDNGSRYLVQVLSSDGEAAACIREDRLLRVVITDGRTRDGCWVAGEDRAAEPWVVRPTRLGAIGNS